MGEYYTYRANILIPSRGEIPYVDITGLLEKRGFSLDSQNDWFSEYLKQKNGHSIKAVVHRELRNAGEFLKGMKDHLLLSEVEFPTDGSYRVRKTDINRITKDIENIVKKHGIEVHTIYEKDHDGYSEMSARPFR